MKKILMLGAIALAVGAFSSDANAKKKGGPGEYTLGTASGYEYCEAIDFTVSNDIVSGQLVYDGTTCPYPSAEVGGVQAHDIPAFGTGQWYIMAANFASGDTNYPAYTLEIFANTKSLVWYAGFESASYSEPFTVEIEGTLVPGAPPAEKGKSLGSLRAALLNKISSHH